MPVTELALLRLKTQDPSPAVKTSFRQAGQAQSDYSKYPARFFRQTEDSSFIYILGGWESTAVHAGEWITSETNQKYLGQLKDDVDIEWMFHLNIDPSTSAIPLDAPVIAVSRYFVDASKKADFDAAFKNGAPYLGAHTAPFSYAGGWRIDKEGDDEEFVLFSGWNKPEDHYAFAETEGFKEFGKIKNSLKGAEIKHVRIEKWE
ncbi:hypothetical protein N7456_009613 [Penicillium angulare]|uniref:Dimeric alpha-beta barrel n=1 Tax=Penicillium angulare TaxID=116970 RepID=A0A9W9K6B1_9EURO|nr:hypothetical protein N7456_009613 [Penicillium angulare]